MEHAYYNCRSCMNQRVRVMTVYGQTYEGVITNVDRENVYLRTDNSNRVETSAYYYNPAASQVLTLSLFTLLAIALI